MISMEGKKREGGNVVRSDFRLRVAGQPSLAANELLQGVTSSSRINDHSSNSNRNPDSKHMNRKETCNPSLLCVVLSADGSNSSSWLYQESFFLL